MDDKGHYILAPTYTLHLCNYSNEYWLEKDSGSSFTINKAIYLFLSQFQKDTSLIDIIDDSFLIEHHSANELRSFFRSMRDRGVLVKSGDNPLTSEHYSNLFSKDDYWNDFRISNLISRNAYVEVYECRKLNKEYVLKALNLPSHLTSIKKNKARASFNHELLVNSKLPNSSHFILPIHSDANEMIWIMPKVEGETLNKYLFRSKPTLDVKKDFANQLITALKLLHNKEIVHGDLHHGNILVTSNKEIKILDFDLSSYGNKHSPQSGGYFPYLAPEQIEDDNFKYHKGFINYQTDIYQLGVLLYYLFYEMLPFYNEHWDELYSRIKKGDIKFSNKAELANVNNTIQKFTSLNPNLRTFKEIKLKNL